MTDEEKLEDEPLEEEEEAEEEPINEEEITPEDAEDPPHPEPETYDNSDLKVEDCMNIDYCTDDKVKANLGKIVDALKTHEEARVRKVSNHDMTVSVNHEQQLKVTPLKTSFSASFKGGKTEKPEVDKVLNFINNNWELEE